MAQARRVPSGPPELHVLPVSGEDRIVYRVVRTANRDSQDFLDSFKSSAELGIPPRQWSPQERFQIIHTGISCFSIAHRAEEQALRWDLGDCVAKLCLPADEGFSYACWGSRDHQTVWGPASVEDEGTAVKLAETMVDIVCIREQGGKS